MLEGIFVINTLLLVLLYDSSGYQVKPHVVFSMSKLYQCCNGITNVITSLQRRLEMHKALLQTTDLIRFNTKLVVEGLNGAYQIFG